MLQSLQVGSFIFGHGCLDRSFHIVAMIETCVMCGNTFLVKAWFFGSLSINLAANAKHLLE